MIMNKKHSTEAPNESVGQAYESSLDSALKKSKQTDTSIHNILNSVDNQNAPSKSGILDDALKLEQSIRRDLIDAAHHMNETGKELKDWLGFDLMLIKNELWKNFTEATDKTTLELLKLKHIAENAEYHTGEIIGLGTLICDQCKATLHFHQPGHIPPCGKCHGTRFHRQHRAT
jgi:hypothetical protein